MNSFSRVNYSKLNSKQKENYNFFKLASVLIDYGYYSHWLNDDWQGADFIASHMDGNTFLKIQLKGRLTFNKKYLGKDIHIAFRAANDWYLYPHDKVCNQLANVLDFQNTKSWTEGGGYDWPRLSKQTLDSLTAYKI